MSFLFTSRRSSSTVSSETAPTSRVFGPALPTTTPPYSNADLPPILPPLDFEDSKNYFRFADWLGTPPSPAATIPEEPTNLELAAMFERRYRGCFDAINARDFGPDSVVWQDLTPNWKSRRTCNFSKGAPEVMDIHEFVGSVEQAAKHMPDVQLNVLDCTTNLYRNDNGKIEFAETFLNLEMSGGPPGIMRRSVAVYNSRLIGGKWLSTGHKSMTGLVVMGPNGIY